MLAGARLDRVDGGGSRCNGPTRSRSQDVTVGGWVTIRGRPTTLTELFRVDSVLSLYKGSSEFDITTFTNGRYADYICYIPRVLAAS